MIHSSKIHFAVERGSRNKMACGNYNPSSTKGQDVNISEQNTIPSFVNKNFYSKKKNEVKLILLFL